MEPHQLRRALKRNPNQCPKCDSEAIESGPIIEPETGTLARHIECSGCGCGWYETYTLSGATTTD